MIKITKRWFGRGYLLRMINQGDTVYNLHGDCPVELAKHATAMWRYV